MTTERSAAAVWRDGVMQSLVAFDPAQPRDDQGQWAADGSDQSGSQSDEEAKELYRQLLAMPPGERDKFLAGLSNDQLTRLGAFASTGKASDGPIADIRNKAGEAMKNRGLDPKAAGLKSKGGKKKPAAKKKSAGKGGGGSKGGGGGKSSGGGGKKSSGGGGSKAKKAPAKKAEPKPKATPKPAAKPAPKPVLAPPERIGGPVNGRPGAPGRPPGPPSTQPAPQGRKSDRRRRPVRSSAALAVELGEHQSSMAQWNAARYAARRSERAGD